MTTPTLEQRLARVEALVEFLVGMQLEHERLQKPLLSLMERQEAAVLKGDRAAWTALRDQRQALALEGERLLIAQMAKLRELVEATP